ncbi:MAG: serine hydrolase [Naasia sp.]|jgi:beta-lactamase class A|uniref:serine hydrolase n=1 Tax=Naasia sp. TaxID=2546198 RepID=UPI00260B9559|nr:serine hydrolase [Naasia sp.]MCU1570232.1 serine hydrolase [Naasia sp.]
MPTADSTRREGRGDAINGRHRGLDRTENFVAGFGALADLALGGAQVSARAVDLSTGKVLLSVDDSLVLPTASIGKVLLLLEVSARIGNGTSSRYDILDREPVDYAADSGIWQHLSAPSFPLADLAALVASTSDNLATNVLLRRVGLDSVRLRAEEIGIRRTALLDRVRDRRGPDDAPQLSVGSAEELTWLFGALARGELIDPATSYRVVDWLMLGMDLSLVAAAFGLDPLAHSRPDHNLTLFNKTGTDQGVRAEAGVLRGPRASVAYAVTLVFQDRRIDDRLEAIGAMRTIGTDLLEYVH